MNRKLFGCCLAAVSLFVPALSFDAVAAPDVQVTKTVVDPLVPPATGVNPGDSMQWTVAVKNIGDVNATAVVITDSTPAGLTFGSNSGACTGAYPCSLGTITPGQTKTITSTYTVGAGYAPPTAVLNTARATYSHTETGTKTNDSSTTVTPIN